MEKSAPTLTLVVEKGPQKGETVQCKPARVGDRVQIGRVARGNTLAIKDAGISQKHLSVDLLDGTRWAVTDFGSSNGTFLNGVQIEPSVPADLRHGDTIKIGEYTSIAVRIEEGHGPEAAEKVAVATGVRRNPRRGATGTSDGPKKEAGGVGRRGRPKPAEVTVRASKQGPILDPALEESEIEVPGVEVKSHGDDAAEGEGRAHLISEESGKVPEKDAAVVKRGRRAPKKTVLEPALEKSEEDLKVMEYSISNIAGKEKQERPDLVVEERVKESHVAANARKGRGPRKGVNPTVKSDSCDGIGAEVEAEAATAAKSNVRKGTVEMDSMTLEDWFDRMEKYLPKVIGDISEEIIAEIKVKAERVNAYVGKSMDPG